MKQLHLFIIFLLFTLFMIPIVHSRTIEVEVYGMTCAFCIDSVERKFNAMESISKVDVSMKQKKIRLETDETAPSFNIIKRTVLDAGFTPINIRIITNEKE